jgi:hypothetical protein
MKLARRYEPEWVELSAYREFKVEKDGAAGSEYRRVVEGETDGERWFEQGDRALLVPVTASRLEGFFAKLGVCQVCNGTRTTADGHALCPKCHGNSPRPYELKGRLAWLREFVQEWTLIDAHSEPLPFDEAGRTALADTLPAFMIFVQAANALASEITEATAGN